jgi:galactoside O-acetyltransferase
MIAKILKLIQKLRFKRHLLAIKPYYSIGNSILQESFRIDMIFLKPIRTVLSIGNDTMLACRVVFESKQGFVSIGNRVFIGNSTIICRTGITFEDDIFCAWGTYFYDHDSHSLDYRDRQKDITGQLEDYRAGRNFIENKDWSVVNSKPIRVCSHAWIGMNCTILKGVTIGEGAIVAAGSVVTKDVPPWTVIAGNPAKVVKELPSELRK